MYGGGVYDMEVGNLQEWWVGGRRVCRGNGRDYVILSYCLYHKYRLSAVRQYAVGRLSESSLSSSTINTFQ